MSGTARSTEGALPRGSAHRHAPSGNESTEEKKETESLEEKKKRVLSLTPGEIAELPYKALSAVSFIAIMIVFGVPLWWLTTSTYRVSFRSFPDDQRIAIPVNVYIVSTNRSSDDMIGRLCLNLRDALRDLPEIEKLDLLFSVHFRKSESVSEPSVSDLDEGRFNAQIVVVEEDAWQFPGKTIYFGPKSWAYVLGTATEERLLQRILTAVTDVLVDTGHLSAIVKRDLRRRMDPLELAALPANQQKRLVWDSAALSAEFLVHVVFAHAGGATMSEHFEPDRVLGDIRKFASKLREVTSLKVSSEHLWDFDMSPWIVNDVEERAVINAHQLSSIVTAVDQETSTVESSSPLLKLLVVDYDKPLLLIDQSGEDSDGLVIASWGAVATLGGERRASVSQSLIASLRVLLGLDTELPRTSRRHPSPVAAWELNRLRLRSFIDYSMNAISSVQAIHKLIAQIDNIVINDEVANAADRAVEAVSAALRTARDTGRIDVALAVEGHALAQRAVNDHSLLALLYFPNDQKFAIYLPLFLPTLLPLFYSMHHLYKYWTGKGDL